LDLDDLKVIILIKITFLNLTIFNYLSNISIYNSKYLIFTFLLLKLESSKKE